MTVRRHAETYLNAAPADVAEAIRWVIGNDPPYSHTIEKADGMEFRTRVRPNWWFLSTEMTVQIQPQSEGTRVIADTKSQFFIVGDLPDFYNHYLRDFLRDVQLELQRKKLQNR
jgi:hypothetical protein